jgi:hypothetical protein
MKSLVYEEPENGEEELRLGLEDTPRIIRQVPFGHKTVLSGFNVAIIFHF